MASNGFHARYFKKRKPHVLLKILRINTRMLTSHRLSCSGRHVPWRQGETPSFPVRFTMLNQSIQQSPTPSDPQSHHEEEPADGAESVVDLAEEFLQLHGGYEERGGIEGLRVSSSAPSFAYEYDTQVAPDSRARVTKKTSGALEEITSVAAEEINDLSQDSLSSLTTAKPSPNDTFSVRPPHRLSEWDWPLAWVVAGHPNPVRVKIQLRSLASANSVFWFVVVSFFIPPPPYCYDLIKAFASP
jgi:hypothetical protein